MLRERTEEKGVKKESRGKAAEVVIEKEMTPREPETGARTKSIFEGKDAETVAESEALERLTREARPHGYASESWPSQLSNFAFHERSAGNRRLFPFASREAGTGAISFDASAMVAKDAAKRMADGVAR